MGKIAETVKAVRTAKGLTQAQFGDLFKPPVEQSTVNRWEKGSNPKPNYLAQIASIAGQTVEELVGLSDIQAREVSPLSERAAELVVRWIGYKLDASHRVTNELAPQLARDLPEVLRFLADPKNHRKPEIEAFFHELAPEAFPLSARN